MRWSSLLLGFATLVVSLRAGPEARDATAVVQPVLEAIGTLESVKDPRCYATASRLEDFLYGTPLTETARHRKVVLQKELIRRLWADSGALARAAGRSVVGSADISAATAKFLTSRQNEQGDVEVTVSEQEPITLEFDDLRQYSGIAYALRALLGVQQDLLLSHDNRFPPLDEAAVQELKRAVDRITLAALQKADQSARVDDLFEISAADFEDSWKRLTARIPAIDEAAPPPAPEQGKPADLTLLRKVIAQKRMAYEATSKLSAPVFLRNIQVYFARHRWPATPEESATLKSTFNEAMAFFAQDLYRGSQKRAELRGQSAARVEDVSGFARLFVPHRIDQNEGALFFPNLPRDQQVEIEAYDVDSFRDSGLHWRYLEAALEDPRFTPTLELDPFAAELLVEAVARYGVLLLRMAGDVAREARDPTLLEAHVPRAVSAIQDRIHRNNSPAPMGAAARATTREIEDTGDTGDVLASSDLLMSADRAGVTSERKTYFTDATAASGIRFRHASSDWLSRLIRGYTIRDGNVAVLAIPPAFGGSGVAAEDVDGDGLVDVLLLSGLGNRLYRNRGDGTFVDVTRAAGLDWRRKEDNRPGEPRQPIIADFDNDGRQDVFLSYAGDDHRLYRNQGGLRFEDVTASAGLGGKGLIGGPAVAADFDRDGLLDLYVGYFGQYNEGVEPTRARGTENGLPNRLFRNRGGMRFEDITEGSGVDGRGWTQALAASDLDRDGLPDLIVGNDFGVNCYYRNLGGGRFVDMAPAYGTDKPSSTKNVGVGDLNGDLYPDVYISNVVALAPDQEGLRSDGESSGTPRLVAANDLFLSRREGGALAGYRLSSAIGSGRESTGWAWGASFLDVDNDGDEDLYCLNGLSEFAVHASGGEPRQETNVFFLNARGKLVDASEASGAGLLGNSRAAAYLDMDLDGDVDMVVNDFHGDAVVYRNNGEALRNHWFTVRLVGDPSKGTTRDAVGARIIARTRAGRSVWREVRAGEAYLTVHPKEQHFGLGPETHADVVVEWPNGRVSRFEGVAAGRRYMVDQTTGELEPRGAE